MRLALLSDTHDDSPAIRAALEILRPHAPDAYLHAGDLVAAEMLEHFAGLPFHFVFGNNEWDHAAIRAMAGRLNLHCHDNAAELEFDGKRIALLHGHEHARLRQLIAAGTHDYVIHGHTHVRCDQRVGPTRVINPGALHRARPRSVALLELSTDTLTFLDISLRT